MPAPRRTRRTRATSPTAPPAQAARTKKPGGGTAAGGGINFQAAVTAIAGTHLLRGTPLGWLRVIDVPVAVWAESEGAGDDLRLELSPAISAEVQAKKGINRGSNLWEALEALITAVMDGRLDHAILAIAPDSSRTVREDLPKDLERLGQGRHDHLTEIGEELHRRVQFIGNAAEQACQRVNIRVVHALMAEDADIRAAKEVLRRVCADERQADAAWNALYHDAVALIEHRGRWTMAHLLRLLQREGVGIRDANFPAAIATKLTGWVRSTRDSFTLPAVRKRIPLSALLDMRTVGTVIDQPDPEDAAVALARYHDAAGALDRDATVYDAEWTGRFRRLAVVVAGPGLGKSTLMTLLANTYAADGFPVLSVKLKPLAAAMERGNGFYHALLSQALDGSGITPERFDVATMTGLVVLADGLDDCGSSHDVVAQALRAFAVGHPFARIVVTTRPIGYTTAAFADWKHYRLLAPEKQRGVENLAKLLNALRVSDDAADDSIVLARRELVASRAAETISSSPLLLGMAAALISSKGKLPNTRPRLYEGLIGLFESAGGMAAPVARSTATYVLDALGWLLMDDPLAPANVLAKRCADLLAGQTGHTPLASLELVEPALGYWERLGIIERLHHGGNAYWTFVHKTFTEFMAARHLLALPDVRRATELNRVIDQPAWHEVIVFSGGLGLGDEIANLLIDRRAAGHPGPMERALALASDKDAEVGGDQVQRLADLAFAAVEIGAKDRFHVGLALAELAEVHPAIVGPIAITRLRDKRHWVQLVAWACVLAAKPEGHDPNEVAQVLRQLLPTVSKAFSASLLGGIRLGGDKDRKLIERIAFAALAAQPDSDLKAFAETHLAHEALESSGFQIKVMALLRARGAADKVELPWARSSALSALALMNPPEEWRRASLKALRALAEAAAGESRQKSRASPDQPRFPQFGALIALTGFNNVPAYDIYEWTGAYDAAAVRVVVQTLVHASAIDPQALADEAAEVVRLVETNDQLMIFELGFPDVDVPDPDWRKAAALVLDRDTLVTAMNHGSAWIACVAGNILAALSATKEQSRALLDDAKGTSLWAAMEVVREQQPKDVANALILDRLAGSLCEGAEHLFKGLHNGAVDRSPAVCEAIARGLASQSTAIAKGAATLARDLAERGQPLDAKMIVDAYDDWLIREPKREGSIIPPSPRETLLKVLISQGALDVERLLASLSDARSDVRSAGEKHMLDVIATSNSLKDAVIERIVSRCMPPTTAASALRREPLLSPEQVRALETLLHDKDPTWRRVGVELLRISYLSADEIAVHATRLSEDDNNEIREAVEMRRAAASVASS